MTSRSLLEELVDLGVSVWQDSLDRGQLAGGTLATRLENLFVRGVTSNPMIFAAALSATDAYAEQITDLGRRGVDIHEAGRLLMTRDIRWACDVLRPVYDNTQGLDGYVSIEVDPGLALISPASLAEARDLAWMVDRPNVMIKIPGTDEALEAITAATAEGICVNVTLIFSPDQYQSVADAFITGLERAQANGRDLARIRSVASFFVSRIDTLVDDRLDHTDAGNASGLRGRAGLACARHAYRRYADWTQSARWKPLEAAGAHPQRLLWASTGVKDARYDPAKYLVGLAAAGTINTMPVGTLMHAANREPEPPIPIGDIADDADEILDSLAAAGIDMPAVSRHLETDGLARFEKSWSELLSRVGSQFDHPRVPTRLDKQTTNAQIQEGAGR